LHGNPHYRNLSTTGLREKKKRFAEGVFRDNSTKNNYGLFHATLLGDASEALCAAVHGKQDKTLPIQYPAGTH